MRETGNEVFMKWCAIWRNYQNRGNIGVWHSLFNSFAAGFSFPLYLLCQIQLGGKRHVLIFPSAPKGNHGWWYEKHETVIYISPQHWDDTKFWRKLCAVPLQQSLFKIGHCYPEFGLSWCFTAKNLPLMQVTHVWSWFHPCSISKEDPLKKKMDTRSSILAWEIPWMEETGGLYSTWGHKKSALTERLNNNIAEFTGSISHAWILFSQKAASCTDP